MTESPILDPQSLPQGPPPPTPPAGDDQGLLVLVCGIAGLFVPLLSFVAVFLGYSTVRQARASGQPLETNFRLGWILGLIGVALQLLVLVLVVFAFSGLLLVLAR